MDWFGVRCVFKLASQNAYEERITLWQADTFEDAIVKAEEEARGYADDTECQYVGLAQAFQMDGEPGYGSEVFSLIRRHEARPNEYLSQFFDTGKEIT